MSLLDDARRLVDYAHGCERCDLCGAGVIAEEEPHHHGCALLAMPGIVAALEAAQGLDEILKAWPEGLDIYGIWSDWSEQAKPKIQALVAALKGDVVP